MAVAPYKRSVLANRLRDKRRSANLQTADVAELLGVAQPTVSRWENGRRPDDVYFDAIAKFLEVDRATVVQMAFADEDGASPPDLRDQRLEALEREVRQMHEALAEVRAMLKQLRSGGDEPEAP